MAEPKYETTDLGLELRSLFINQKQKKFPRYNIPGNSFQDCFERMAEIVEELKADPEAYIFAQFYNRGEDAKILPQFLHSTEAIKRYVEFVSKQNIITLDTIFNENVQRLKNQMSLNFSVKDILMSKSFDFRPWFRICITSEPIPEVIKEFKEAAQAQFNDQIKELLINHKLDYKRITQ